MAQSKLHTISLFCAHKPGVLMRICLIFARRGFNIESLVVSSARDGRFARMTITAEGEVNSLGKIIDQIRKLVDVVSCHENADLKAIEVETALIKMKTTSESRTDVLQIADHFGAETVDFTEDSLILKVTGSTERLDDMYDLLKKYGIIELVRSGKMLMSRGSEPT